MALVNRTLNPASTAGAAKGDGEVGLAHAGRPETSTFSAWAT